MTALSLPVAGCDSEFYGASWKTWGDAMGVATGLKPSPGVTREQAAQIPFATIGFRMGEGPESLLVLASKSQQDSLWTSSQRIAILTTDGRIRRTSGFQWNLNQTSFTQEDPVGTLVLMNPPSHSFERRCDFDDIKQFQVGIGATFRVEEKETISILGSDLETIRVAEHCQCEKWGWNFQNYYWIDSDSGFVWRSIQTIHPNLGSLTIEVLRPQS